MLLDENHTPNFEQSIGPLTERNLFNVELISPGRLLRCVRFRLYLGAHDQGLAGGQVCHAGFLQLGDFLGQDGEDGARDKNLESPLQLLEVAEPPPHLKLLKGRRGHHLGMLCVGEGQVGGRNIEVNP